MGSRHRDRSRDRDRRDRDRDKDRDRDRKDRRRSRDRHRSRDRDRDRDRRHRTRSRDRSRERSRGRSRDHRISEETSPEPDGQKLLAETLATIAASRNYASAIAMQQQEEYDDNMTPGKNLSALPQPSHLQKVTRSQRLHV